MAYERSAIRSMAGYVPGKQPEGASAIKLNTNENPYPPCAGVLAALQTIGGHDLRRYPPPTAIELRADLARLHGLDVEHVIAVHAGDELLRLAMRTFVDDGEPVGVLDPSYSLVPVLANIGGCPVVEIGSDEDFAPPADFAARLNDAGVKLTFLVNPHAPSGHLLPGDRLRAIAQALDGVLLIDEAYVDFVDPALRHDATGLVRELDNVLILRTFSKGYSLAGLRAGYGLGSPGLIEPMLTKTKDSYNLDIVAQRVARAAIAHREAARETWNKVRRDREILTRRLTDLGFAIPASETNFVLAQVPAPHDAAALLAGLERRGYLVRHFRHPRLAHRLRITVGTPDENAGFLEALTELLREPPAGPR